MERPGMRGASSAIPANRGLTVIVTHLPRPTSRGGLTPTRSRQWAEWRGRNPHSDPQQWRPEVRSVFSWGRNVAPPERSVTLRSLHVEDFLHLSLSSGDELEPAEAVTRAEEPEPEHWTTAIREHEPETWPAELRKAIRDGREILQQNPDKPRVRNSRLVDGIRLQFVVTRTGYERVWVRAQERVRAQQQPTAQRRCHHRRN